MYKAKEILRYFECWQLDVESRQYLKLQHPRYAFLLNEIEKVVKKIQNPNRIEPIKILDIGPAYQTELMRQRFKDALINTLGFEDIRFRPREGERHFQFDLNELENKLKWPEMEKYDLIIMAEVIEHLYTSLYLVLEFISILIKKNGYLIISTPNAVSLRKRLIMLRGINPQEMIRLDRINPGHFREYTLQELVSVAKDKDLSLLYYRCINYRDSSSGLKLRLYDLACNLLPPVFREEIFLCLKKN